MSRRAFHSPGTSRGRVPGKGTITFPPAAFPTASRTPCLPPGRAARKATAWPPQKTPFGGARLRVLAGPTKTSAAADFHPNVC
ncbi:jg17739 [Pararge aegeria aegeria]|uniref:Jg17739 protein n=1 Tax=Pararge aegeria aegeria TaxID=348720 RepID=A0A8S4S943_9NEOP|nr:jg17739 [Pararge aegeria aegeria]